MISDINECDFDPCHVSATCTDTHGSYICTCDNGFTGDGLTCQSKYIVSIHWHYLQSLMIYQLLILQILLSVLLIFVISMPCVSTLMVRTLVPAMLDSQEMD